MNINILKDKQQLKELVSNERQFNKFLSENAKFVYSVCSKFHNYRHEADDIKQIAMISFVRAIEVLLKTERLGNPVSFAITLMKNDILSYLRENKCKTKYANIEFCNPSYNGFEDDVLFKVTMEEETANLSDLERQILLLKMEGKSKNKIAEELGCSYNKVKNIWYAKLVPQLSRSLVCYAS